MFDDYGNVRFSPCMHRHLTTEMTGRRHFSEGEIWDDIQERLRCLDCLEYVTEDEVRAAWGQLSMLLEESSHGNN